MEIRYNLRKVALLAGAALLSTSAMIGVAALPLVAAAVTKATVQYRVADTGAKLEHAALFETVANR